VSLTSTLASLDVMRVTIRSVPSARHRVERVLHQVEQRLAQLAGDAAHRDVGREALLERDDAPLRALLPHRPRHRHDLLDHDREIDDVLPRSEQRLLADEPPDARRGRGAGLRGARDSHRVVAHRRGFSAFISRRYAAAMIGLSALFTSCITPAASCPTAASRRSRAAASCSASSSRVRSFTIRSRRSASVCTAVADACAP
jgi:hypothetical protein